jgi:N-acyl-D-amino-acid deacylase
MARMFPLVALSFLVPGTSFRYRHSPCARCRRIGPRKPESDTGRDCQDERLHASSHAGWRGGTFYRLVFTCPQFQVNRRSVELAKVVAGFGGMHISHMRDETSIVLNSVRETIRIGEEGGLPAQVTHHEIIGAQNWGKSVDTLRLIEEAQVRGADATIDAYPYTASSTGTAALFPQWSLAGGHPVLIERLSAQDKRARITSEWRIALSILRSPQRAWPISPSPAAARSASKRPRKPQLRLSKRVVAKPSITAISEEDVERILRSPYTRIGSDGEIPTTRAATEHSREYWYATFAKERS